MAGFSAASFKSKLDRLSERAESIQTLSHWVQYHKKACKQSAQLWCEETLAASSERKLLYVYLANDIMQTSRKKGNDFIDAYGEQLPAVLAATYQGSPEAVRAKLLRLLNIWEERRVLAPDVLSRLRVAMTGTGQGGPGHVAAAPAAPAAGSPPSLAPSNLPPPPLAAGAPLSDVLAALGEPSTAPSPLEAKLAAMGDDTAASLEDLSAVADVDEMRTRQGQVRRRASSWSWSSCVVVVRRRASSCVVVVVRRRRRRRVAHARPFPIWQAASYASLLASRGEEVRAELKDRHALILVLAQAVEAQEARCVTLRASLQQNEALSARAEAARAQAAERVRCTAADGRMRSSRWQCLLVLVLLPTAAFPKYGRCSRWRRSCQWRRRR